MQIRSVGIDLGKTTFHLVALGDTATIAARLLLATLLLWLLLFRLPNFLHEPLFAACWTVFPLAVMLAAAWVPYVWFAADSDRKHLGFQQQQRSAHRPRTLRPLVDLLLFGDDVESIGMKSPKPRFAEVGCARPL
jgi:hypothetical protein